MAYHDLFFKAQDPERALQAIPPLLAALGESRVWNMIGPVQGRAAIEDGDVVIPAAGDPAWWYAAVRTQRDPAEILGAVDLAAYGIAVAERAEVEEVVGTWA